MTLPTLVIVSGPPGTGKTTLAHQVARTLGCPAIIRDEIKQGMVLSIPGYRPSRDDPVNDAALEAFFGVLRILLPAGVTVVAEAAFQDRLWKPNLEPLLAYADLRIIRCTTDTATAIQRMTQRAGNDPHRSAHADRDRLRAIAEGDRSMDTFAHISLDAPALTVDTTAGYQPGLDDIAAFIAKPDDQSKRPSSELPHLRWQPAPSVLPINLRHPSSRRCSASDQLARDRCRRHSAESGRIGGYGGQAR
jgi:predicted kinase